MNFNRFFSECLIASALIGLFACSEDPGLQVQKHPLSIPPGMLAVSLRWNGNGCFVLPGSHVDVIAVNKSYEPQITTVLENIEVAAFDPANQDTDGTVTLLMSSNDAKKLAEAQQKRQIKIVMRSEQRSGSFICMADLTTNNS